MITPYINSKIGPSVWANELSKTLIRKNISTKILTIADEDEEIPTFVHKGHKIEKRIIKYPFISIICPITKISKKEKIDIIHVNNPLIGGFGAVLAKKLTKTPVVLSLHGLYFDELNEWVKEYFKNFGKLKTPLTKSTSLILSKIGEYVLTHSNKVIVPNDYLKRYLEVRRIDSEVIPNGVNPTLFNEAPLFQQHERKILLSISHMDVYKKSEGLKTIFNAIKLLRNEVELWIVGTGKYEKNLKDYCKKKELPVKFLGYRNDVPRLLNESDIYVHASLQDVFPIVILEAMASKKPIIALNVGGIPELIKNGQNGFLCDPNPSDIAKKIDLLMKNECISRKLTQNAFEDVLKKYTWDKVTDNYINLYAKIDKK